MLHPEDKARYLRLLKYLIPVRRMAALAVVTTMLYGAGEMLMPWVMKGLVDDGFAGEGDAHHYGVILFYVGAMFFGFALRGTVNYLSSYATTRVGQRIIHTLRLEMFAKLQVLPMRYFGEHSQGAILSKFTYDVNQLLSAVTGSLIQILRDVVSIVALIFWLFYLDWKMSLILMTAAPFVAWVIIFVSRRLRSISHRLQAQMGGINHVIDEAVRGRTIVRIYNGYMHEEKRFREQADGIEHSVLASTRVSSATSPILEMIIILSLSGVILFAAAQPPAQMSIGKFISFLGAMALLFPPVKRIGKVNEAIQRALAAMESVFSFLDQEEEALDGQTVNIRDGEIHFDDISFKYGELPVLEHFSLKIAAGETVALVGESGSGKSTLAALLAGFYPPDAGTIRIDGHDMADISLAARRTAMAYVSQETMLFAASIADNIAYADPEPDHERIIRAAQSANAEEFILSLENGYDTFVGEAGGRLSGGQRQRIAIARALYKDAPILILDEATSALDNRSEQKVQQAIDHLRQNRTAIIIAHRLSTIENADRIVVLEQGRIIEEGNHRTLMKKNGYYANLLRRHPEKIQNPHS